MVRQAASTCSESLSLSCHFCLPCMTAVCTSCKSVPIGQYQSLVPQKLVYMAPCSNSKVVAVVKACDWVTVPGSFIGSGETRPSTCNENACYVKVEVTTLYPRQTTVVGWTSLRYCDVPTGSFPFPALLHADLNNFQVCEALTNKASRQQARRSLSMLILPKSIVSERVDICRV